MDYQTCLNACISNALAEGAEADAATYRSFPTPSDEEWAECLQEVADCPFEKLENPYHCMGRYEVRLDRRGIKTVLGMVADEFKASAIRVGLPFEHLPDAIMLSEMLKAERGTPTPIRPLKVGCHELSRITLACLIGEDLVKGKAA